MPFTDGNKLSQGVSEGKTGRKSAFDEHQDASFIADVWENAQDVDALEQKIMSKKYSGRDITILRLLKGSERLMAKFMDKLVPDKHDHTSLGDRIEMPNPLLYALRNNDSNKEDSSDVETNTSDSGGNISG